jgi:hypothetical protein
MLSAPLERGPFALGYDLGYELLVLFRRRVFGMNFQWEKGILGEWE